MSSLRAYRYQLRSSAALERQLRRYERARVQDRRRGQRGRAGHVEKAGTYFGRVAIRQTGSFNIQTADVVVQGISHKHCRIASRSGTSCASQRGDGYGYSYSTNKSQAEIKERTREAGHAHA